MYRRMLSGMLMVGGLLAVAGHLAAQELIFADGFESGDTSAWSGPADQIVFTTEGDRFEPVITVTGSPVILWTFSDGTTSASAAPSKVFGSAGTRLQSLRVTPWSAVQRINIGYDGGDGGSPAIEYVADQQVSAVDNLQLVAATLRQWCSSYNQLTSLDFSNFVSLDTIECFLSSTLTSVNLANTPSLQRACFEDNSLAALDVSESPQLEDLRGALNDYTTITFGQTGAHVWHICVRDNPQMTDQDLFSDLTQFPNLSELFIWNDNQAGELRLPASHPTSSVMVLADGNHYSSLDLTGALTNLTAAGVLSLRYNQLTSIDIGGCLQLTEIYLEENLLDATELDALLAVLDGLGRSRVNTPDWITLVVNLTGNATPSTAGYSSALNLGSKGWTVIADGWRVDPWVPDTGEAQIDLSTSGDSTRLRCDFSSPATATWYWSDGTTSPAVSGETIERTGLGAGVHDHSLVISNGSALIRFGAPDGGGLGSLVSILGLDDAPRLQVLYAYAETKLTTLGRTDTTSLCEYHLMATALSPAAMDQVFADAVLSTVVNGILWGPSAGTSASDGDRATLLSRGWSLYF